MDPQNNNQHPSTQNNDRSQQAATDLIRHQIDNIYSGGSGENTPHTTPVELPAERTFPTAPTREMDISPAYQRTMSTTLQPQQTADKQKQWKEYHSAWQQYYQMYYERYYLNSLYNKKQAANQPDKPNIVKNQPQDSLTQAEAMAELRESIRQKVADGAGKIQKSRHFIPILSGVFVVLLLLFIQYNRIVFGAVAAYVSPGDINPQNIIVDPTVNIKVGEEPKLIIPKINIDAPVLYGVGADYKSQMAAMAKGVAHFSISGANAMPGQIGNAVFAGHSSNDVFAGGDYKFIFAQNEKLVKNDIIYLNYKGKRYTYSVTDTKVVMPTDVNAVQVKTDKPMVTLVSCVPLGTAQKRLLVFAEQISPSPDDAKPSPIKPTPEQSTADIPGQPSPTLFDQLFGR